MKTLISRISNQMGGFKIVLHNRRLFRVDILPSMTGKDRGEVSPLFVRGHREKEFASNPHAPSMTGIDSWKLSTFNEKVIIVQLIQTHEEKRHLGWAGDMVEVLMGLYPDHKVEVECPNESSAGLFNHLFRKYPDRVKQPVIEEI